jgi:RNA polymerase sigma-70 factor, ECF subfamily
MDSGEVSRNEREARLTAAFDAHYHHVLAYALRRLGGRREPAEEVASDTFSVAWRRIDRMPEDDSLPWLYSIARRVLANELRGSRRRERLVFELATSSPANPREPDDVVLARTEIAQALMRMPDSQRELVLLIAWEGLTNREAAIALGCSRAALDTRLHRARRRLSKELASLGHMRGEAGDGPREAQGEPT